MWITIRRELRQANISASQNSCDLHASRHITSAGGVAQLYSMSYAYDVSGNEIRETYPSGKVIETEYDSAGRIAGVKRQGTGMYYAGGPVVRVQ